MQRLITQMPLSWRLLSSLNTAVPFPQAYAWLIKSFKLLKLLVGLRAEHPEPRCAGLQQEHQADLSGYRSAQGSAAREGLRHREVHRKVLQPAPLPDGTPLRFPS